MPEFFSQRDVNRLFRTPSRTIRFWVERGLVEIADSFEDGRGKHRKYSRDSLVQLAIVETLMGLNFSINEVSRIMHERVHGRQPKGKITLAWSKSAMDLLAPLINGSDPMENQEVVLTINFDTIVERVNRMVNKL